MHEFTRSDDLQGARFVDTDLRQARFVGADLSGAVMRGVQVDGTDIDAPWLLSGEAALLVNGVDVAPFVAAELDRRFPGRSRRRAEDPQGLRTAWEAVQDTWDAVRARAEAMPAGTVDVSVDGEWSFAQTLRHLVRATDTWLGKGVLRLDQPYHPLGLLDVATAADGEEPGIGAAAEPSYDDVLAARADRVALVREFLATVTPEELGEERANPHDPAYPETVRSCLHVILEEEWEHLRYAVRDLDAIEAGS